MSETIEASQFTEPFPHLILYDFYNQEELDLIWEELKFYTKPGKLYLQKIMVELSIKQMLMLSYLMMSIKKNIEEYQIF